MSADFKPNKNTLKHVESFDYWCQKVLPLVYDESLSYYELLCKVSEILNRLIENSSKLGNDVSGLHKAYVQLQDYVNNYYLTIGVQNEINNKLDAMVADGTFGSFLTSLIYYATPQMYGAKGDGVTDDTQAFKMLLANETNIFIPSGAYVISETLTLQNNKMTIIRGVNRVESVIKYVGASESFLFDITGTKEGNRVFCEFYTLSCVGNNTNSGFKMAYNSDKFKMSDVGLSNFKYGVHTSNNWNHSFYDCVILNCDIGLYGTRINAINFNNLIAMFCRINVRIDTSRNINFVGGDFSAGVEHCMYLYNIMGGGIYSSYIEKASSVGIYLLGCNGFKVNCVNYSVFYENTVLLDINNSSGINVTGFNTETGIESTNTIANCTAIRIVDSLGVNVCNCEISNIAIGVFIKNAKGVCDNNIFNYTTTPYKLEQHYYVFYDFVMRLTDFNKSVIGVCENTCNFRFTDVRTIYTKLSDIPEINCSGYCVVCAGKPIWKYSGNWVDATGATVS